MTNEYLVEQSTSKWSRLSRESFAVGALARLNNNFTFLHPTAKEIAASFGLKPVNHNPYMNNIAQLVECVHVVHGFSGTDRRAAGHDLAGTDANRSSPKAGSVSAPLRCRGGFSTTATSSMRKAGSSSAATALSPRARTTPISSTISPPWPLNAHHRGMQDREIELLAQMLVRSYDPCISCSVH